MKFNFFFLSLSLFLFCFPLFHFARSNFVPPRSCNIKPCGPPRGCNFELPAYFITWSLFLNKPLPILIKVLKFAHARKPILMALLSSMVVIKIMMIKGWHNNWYHGHYYCHNEICCWMSIVILCCKRKWIYPTLLRTPWEDNEKNIPDAEDQEIDIYSVGGFYGKERRRERGKKSS